MGRDLEQDLKIRNAIYDSYEEYRSWKVSNNMYDFGDCVLRLLQLDWPKQLFASGKIAASDV